MITTIATVLAFLLIPDADSNAAVVVLLERGASNRSALVWVAPGGAVRRQVLTGPTTVVDQRLPTIQPGMFVAAQGDGLRLTWRDGGTWQGWLPTRSPARPMWAAGAEEPLQLIIPSTITDTPMPVVMRGRLGEVSGIGMWTTGSGWLHRREGVVVRSWHGRLTPNRCGPVVDLPAIDWGRGRLTTVGACGVDEPFVQHWQRLSKDQRDTTLIVGP